MKISKSKQELARIISENGGWRDGVEFTAQDKDGLVYHYATKPTIGAGNGVWHHKGCIGEGEFTAETLPNWHQTTLSRAEYFHMYPAPDADGWIEWEGGECPVDEGTLIDVRYRDGHEQAGCKCGVWGDELYATSYWLNSGGHSNIIAYRLHKPEQATEKDKGTDWFSPEADAIIDGASVIKGFLSKTTKPTIERLAANYRNAKDCAERKRQEADAAGADADAKLAELVAAGEAIGLVLGVEPVEPELVITDWRDLQVGDEVECLQINITGDDYADQRIGTIGLVSATEEPGRSGQAVKLKFNDDEYFWVSGWRFIRRP